MSKFGGFLARKSGIAEKSTVLPSNELDIDEELFTAIGTQMGGDNESLRNLLIDAGFKINELDAIRDTIGKLIEPVAKTLCAFEAEKTEKIGLQTILNNTRTEYGKLRNVVGDLEKKAAAAEGECQQLRQELAASQHTVRTLENTRAELALDIAARRTRIADLESGLMQATAEGNRLNETNLRLDERLVAGDKRSIQLENELNATRQKLALADDEKRSLQLSLDKTISEAARLSRRLAEAENTLAATQARLRQVETNFTEADNERLRLTGEIQAFGERHQSELDSQRTRFEALNSRAAATDRLLNEAREQLTQRAEEIRTLDRRQNEALLARNAMESKLAEHEVTRINRESAIKDLEQSRATLLERSTTFAKALTTRETALARAEEKIQSLSDRIAIIESQSETGRQLAENEKAELKAALKREQLERLVVEGALESGRKDISRLLREVMALQRRQSAEQDAGPAPLAANAA